MKRTFVDEEGNVVCPVCGAKNQFRQRRFPRALQCNGCGHNVKPGGRVKSSGGPTPPKPIAPGYSDPG